MVANVTKDMLAQGLYDLLKSKKLDDIFVKDICKQCNVSKQTFYYHFKDKYDLALYMYNALESEKLAKFGVGDYIKELESGNPALNDASEENIPIQVEIVRHWWDEDRDVARNLLRYPDDANSPENTRRAAARKGRRSMLERELQSQNRTMDNDTLDLAADVMCFIADWFYDRWNVKYPGELPADEAKRLVELTQQNLEFWASLGIKKN